MHYKNNCLLLLFISLLFSCKQKSIKIQASSPIPENIENTEKIEIDTSKWYLSNWYIQYIPASETTVFIKWGNGSLENISSETYDYEFLRSKLYVNRLWYSKDFIALYIDTGSDTWSHIILPLHSNANLFEVGNALAFDKKRGYAVVESCNADSPLVIQNLKNGHRINIGMDWEKCSSIAFCHHCIDSISLKDNRLYVEWMPETTLEDKAKKQIKRISLKL